MRSAKGSQRGVRLVHPNNDAAKSIPLGKGIRWQKRLSREIVNQANLPNRSSHLSEVDKPPKSGRQTPEVMSTNPRSQVNKLPKSGRQTPEVRSTTPELGRQTPEVRSTNSRSQVDKPSDQQIQPNQPNQSFQPVQPARSLQSVKSVQPNKSESATRNSGHRHQRKPRYSVPAGTSTGERGRPSGKQQNPC